MLNQENKADGGKTNPALLHEDMGFALYLVNRVLDYGAEKYVRAGWKKVEPKRYEAAKKRHRDDREVFGELNDKESGLLHRAHEATNALFLLQLEVEELFANNPAGSLAEFVKLLGQYNPPPQEHKKAEEPPARKKYVRLNEQEQEELFSTWSVANGRLTFEAVGKMFNVSANAARSIVRTRQLHVVQFDLNELNEDIA